MQYRAAASLFVAADVHALEHQSRLYDILTMIAADKTAVQPEIVLLGGDYVGGGKPPSIEADRICRWQPVFCLDDLRKTIQAALGEKVTSYFTYGSHDKNEISGGKDFFCGSADCGAYYLYGISFCQMRFATEQQRIDSGYDGVDSGNAMDAATYFSKWELSLCDCKPIFVMSHLPLHVHRGDNRGAEIWSRVLNEAAKRHDIFVFFAHNHSTERRTAYDRSFYLVPAGSSMSVQGAEKDTHRDMRLRFTYLNAGYILHGCGTLLTLMDQDRDGKYDVLSIRRYALEAHERDFGNSGFSSPYNCMLTAPNRETQF